MWRILSFDKSCSMSDIKLPPMESGWYYTYNEDNSEVLFGNDGTSNNNGQYNLITTYTFGV